MIRLNIDLTSPVPAYLQVIQALKLEILSGRLGDGDRLPPIRELAKILKLNPNTVAKSLLRFGERGLHREPAGERELGQDPGRRPRQSPQEPA